MATKSPKCNEGGSLRDTQSCHVGSVVYVDPLVYANLYLAPVDGGLGGGALNPLLLSLREGRAATAEAISEIVLSIIIVQIKKPTNP
jgi:hypothetical protein